MTHITAPAATEPPTSSLERLWRQYREAGAQIRQLATLNIADGLDPEKREKRLRGLEMANDWIVAEAATQPAEKLADVELKVRLLSAHMKHRLGDEDPTPECTLAGSILNDLKHRVDNDN